MGSENDRLSSLPDDLIYKILSLNDTLDAVKTSTLSSRWRFIWTTMTCLAFSTEDFSNLRKFSKFVKHVLSGRDNRREVSSVKLTFRGKVIQVFVKRILEYAVSHNVQQLEITCLVEDIELPLSLFSSQTLKHLILNMRGYTSMTLTSRWEVPVLSTLHLNKITLSHDNFSGLISKCVNLKNLTITSCIISGPSNIGFKIFHSQLSNLALEEVYWDARLLTVVAPQLKNLVIRRSVSTSVGFEIMISAPDLAYLLLQSYDFINCSADNFHSLEKADIAITIPFKKDPQNIVGLFQLLRSVNNLTLNLEILEHLSSSVEIVSHQPSPFANLKSLKIYPALVYDCQLPNEMISMSTEVKNYLLDGSPGATFTMVSREEIIAERNVTDVKGHMASLQVHLEQVNADMETKRAHTEQENVPIESGNAKTDEEENALDENELEIEGDIEHIISSWESLGEQIKQGKRKIGCIVFELRGIKNLMIELPASNRAEMQPYFSSLCAQADVVMSKIRDCMKVQLEENQRCSNVYFHELTKTLQSS